MASMTKKRMEYLKRRHKKEGDIRLDNAKMLALLSELTIMKEKPMNSNDWVAEHVMGFERGYCLGAMGGNGSGGESWFYCDWCGRRIYYGKASPCPSYPFPKFTLVDLMRELGEKGHYGSIYYTAARHYDFTITLGGHHIYALDPLQALCDYLYRHQSLYPPKGKHFVGGEQVLEEYIPGYEQFRGLVDCGKLDWGLLCSRGEGECSKRRWNRNDPYVVATLNKPMREEGPSPAFFANIRDAIKLLQKAMGQEER